MPVVGSQEDRALSGWDEAPADGPVFALGDVQAASADVRFAGAGTGRLVAPHGDGLWRRAPRPVRDELFALPPAADPDAVLVIAPSAEAIARDLDELGARASTAVASSGGSSSNSSSRTGQGARRQSPSPLGAIRRPSPVAENRTSVASACASPSANTGPSAGASSHPDRARSSGDPTTGISGASPS